MLLTPSKMYSGSILKPGNKREEINIALKRVSRISVQIVRFKQCLVQKCKSCAILVQYIFFVQYFLLFFLINNFFFRNIF